jgi:hypothetical protein
MSGGTSSLVDMDVGFFKIQSGKRLKGRRIAPCKQIV